jgi:hypothetical protein
MQRSYGLKKMPVKLWKTFENGSVWQTIDLKIDGIS